MRRFKLITFDLDDTLWHAKPAIDRAVQLWFEFLTQQFPRFGDRFDQAAVFELRQRLADHVLVAELLEPFRLGIHP